MYIKEVKLNPLSVCPSTIALFFGSAGILTPLLLGGKVSIPTLIMFGLLAIGGLVELMIPLTNLLLVNKYGKIESGIITKYDTEIEDNYIKRIVCLRTKDNIYESDVRYRIEDCKYPVGEVVHFN